MLERVRVKICGLMRRQDALDADRLGADYLGVVTSEGYGRSVDASNGRRLLEGTRALKVAVTVDEGPERAAWLARRLGADVIQLHGDERPAVLSDLRSRGTWKLWKAVRALTPEDLELAVRDYEGLVDGILVEVHVSRGVGGTGAEVLLDADLVRAVIPAGVDFLLAGGLTPSTVADATGRFVPDIVDVSSGIERAPGEKDPELVRTFIESARLASGRRSNRSRG